MCKFLILALLMSFGIAEAKPSSSKKDKVLLEYEKKNQLDIDVFELIYGLKTFEAAEIINSRKNPLFDDYVIAQMMKIYCAWRWEKQFDINKVMVEFDDFVIYMISHRHHYHCYEIYKESNK